MKTLQQARNAIARYELSEVAARQPLSFYTCNTTGTPHMGSHKLGSDLTYVSGSIGAYLEAPNRCDVCDGRIGDIFRRYGPGHALLDLVGAYAAVASARRAVGAGDLSADRLYRLRETVNKKARRASGHANRLDADALAALQQAVDEATGALQEASRESVEAVLTQVREALVPGLDAEHVPWDTTPMLIGVVGRVPNVKGLASIVVEALTLPGPAGQTLLRGPAYVTDFLHRSFGLDTYSRYFLTTAKSLGVEHDQVVASLWAPKTPGPMAHLPHVVEVAATITTQ